MNLASLLSIKYPIIQAGMVWVSGAKLASASANAGCLGVIGCASMSLDLIEHHIKKAQSLTKGQLAVNIPLMYEKVSEQIEIALRNNIKIFITSAGNPKLFTKQLKNENCTVLHVVSSPKFAQKAEDSKVDIIIAEGFEAGGHNGKDETTSLVLIPEVINQVSIPVVAAGGIATGKQMLAMMALGACGVQIGSRFATTQESSAHDKFKSAVVSSLPGETKLSMKKHIPVRLLKNQFSKQIETLENKGASREEIIQVLGKGRAKQGIFEGDLENGELEIGQASSLIKEILSTEDLVELIIKEFYEAKSQLSSL